MHHTYVSAERRRIDFAEAAARHFAANPKHWSYTANSIEPGALLALRWGMGDDCVLVVEIGDLQPVVYGQLVTTVDTIHADAEE